MAGARTILKQLANGSPKMSKHLTAGAIATTAVNAWGAKTDYDTAREEGYGVIGSTAKAATSFVTGEILGIKGMLAVGALKTIPKGIVAGAETLGKVERQMNMESRQVPFINSHFNDFNQAYTMRQAGMQAAQQSKYNLQQSLLGNEASYLRK